MIEKLLAILTMALCAAGLWGASTAALAQSAAAPAASSASAAASAVTAGDARQGTFKTVQGSVTLARAAARQAVVVGDPVLVGDRILTGPNSAAALTLRDGTVLSIGADSNLVLSAFHFEPTTQEGNMLMALLHGSLRVVTGLIAKMQPEQVKVTTPTTVIGVRGTDFIVEQAR